MVTRSQLRALAEEEEKKAAATARTSQASLAKQLRKLFPDLQEDGEFWRRFGFAEWREFQIVVEPMFNSVGQSPARIAHLTWLLKEAERFARAESGDIKAMVAVLKVAPLDAVSNPRIAECIRELMGTGRKADRDSLKLISEAFRRGLLRDRGPGEFHKWSQSAAVAREAQTAFEKCPVKMKRRYNNDAAMQMDIRAIADHVASSVPSAKRNLVHRVATRVLSREQLPRIAFGVEVAAEVFGCSPRWIRWTLSKF